ncbi:MAG: hypothetical protein EZS28_023494 [Streblomastix strix]|uniref:Uncharacterized protein n=1 Tax=Streblomastix strix TaxID=222440 RepID=A0A5J4VEL4_9EUKA|nr:MAG: hypothetical protein EZS28_023494 [Streblomastix strix]
MKERVNLVIHIKQKQVEVLVDLAVNEFDGYYLFIVLVMGLEGMVDDVQLNQLYGLHDLLHDFDSYSTHQQSMQDDN